MAFLFAIPSFLLLGGLGIVIWAEAKDTRRCEIARDSISLRKRRQSSLLVGLSRPHAVRFNPVLAAREVVVAVPIDSPRGCVLVAKRGFPCYILIRVTLGQRARTLSRL